MGQQHVLQLLCRAAYVLRATSSGSFAIVHTFTERAMGRLIQTLTPKMVTSLADAGWLEREPGQSQATVWTYRMTQVGVAAVNLHVMDEQ